MDRLTQPMRAPRLQSGHGLVLMTGGQALFAAMAQDMDEARSSIHLETYIFDFNGGPLQVAEALERASARGVTVRLLVDGIGTPRVPDAWQLRFRQAGVQWRVYEPLGKLGLLLPRRWRRLHRKLCVIDGVLGFCGGINLLDDHRDVGGEVLDYPRFDFALRCTGPLVERMSETMLQLWWRVLAVSRARQRAFGAAWDALRSTAPVADFSKWRWPAGGWGPGERWHAESTHAVAPPVVDNAQAMLVLRDNIWHRADIERSYLKAIGEARSEVLLANAYFVPGRRMRRALVLAARRGVSVRVLLQGQYESFMQYHAARPVYQQLIDAGVDVREYTPSALHAKVAVVDGVWATVGSSNLDPLSLSLNLEANLIIRDHTFNQRLHDHLTELGASKCKKVTLERVMRGYWWRAPIIFLTFHFLRHFPAIAGWFPAHSPRLKPLTPADAVPVSEAQSPGMPCNTEESR
jgi:cardiolipin synthase A/B